MVMILNAALSDGLEALEAACAEALSAQLASADVVLNALARARQTPVPACIAVAQALALHQAPLADCGRYDTLRSRADAAR